MKVISGLLKGRNIKGFDIDGTRPTMDRVKESLFSIIQSYINDAIVLDLFAGSGNLGIEAISNGCKKCYFVDKNKIACNVIKENISNFKIDNGTVINDDYMNALNNLKDIKFDLIFLDPPYKYDYYVNEVAVSEGADSSSFEYTFEEAGIYTVKAVVTNRFGVSCDKEMEIEVVEPYSLDTPVICGVYYSGLSFGIFADECKDVKMIVNTVGGTQPYQYKFTFNNGTDKPVVQDFSNSNTFVFEGKLEIGEYTMLIEVKDELGQVTSRNVPVIVEEAKLA